MVVDWCMMSCLVFRAISDDMVEVVVVQCFVIVRLRPRPKPGVPRPKASAARWNRAKNWAYQQHKDKKAAQEQRAQGGGGGDKPGHRGYSRSHSRSGYGGSSGSSSRR